MRLGSGFVEGGEGGGWGAWMWDFVVGGLGVNTGWDGTESVGEGRDEGGIERRGR